METTAMVGKPAKIKLMQAVLPGLVGPGQLKEISIRFLPTSPYFFMLSYLAKGYDMKPLQYIKWVIQNNFEYFISEWGYNYERRPKAD